MPPAQPIELCVHLEMIDLTNSESTRSMVREVEFSGEVRIGQTLWVDNPNGFTEEGFTLPNRRVIRKRELNEMAGYDENQSFMLDENVLIRLIDGVEVFPSRLRTTGEF